MRGALPLFSRHTVIMPFFLSSVSLVNMYYANKYNLKSFARQVIRIRRMLLFFNWNTTTKFPRRSEKRGAVVWSEMHLLCLVGGEGSYIYPHTFNNIVYPNKLLLY